MSNPLYMEIADLQEINAGIVKRQKAAIAFLEQIETDQLDCNEMIGAEETRHVINILTGKVPTT